MKIPGIIQPNFGDFRLFDDLMINMVKYICNCFLRIITWSGTSSYNDFVTEILERYTDEILSAFEEGTANETATERVGE